MSRSLPFYFFNYLQPSHLKNKSIMTNGVEMKLDEIKDFISQQVFARKEILNLSEAAAGIL